jgi:hypothetical protein
MIEAWRGKRIQIVHMTTLTSRSVRRGFGPKPTFATISPPTMKPRLKTPKIAPTPPRRQRQAVGIHQRQEDAAEEVVEGLEDEQRRQPRHGANHPNGARQVNGGVGTTRLGTVCIASLA